MNTNELKSFLMVYEYRSFSVAAKYLFVTQPAITKRINNLENYLKLKLFEQRGNLLFPTLEAERLIPYARQIIHILTSMSDNLKNVQFNQIPILIGTTLYPAILCLPKLTDYLIENNENSLMLQIRQVVNQDLSLQLMNGFIDIALATEDARVDKAIKMGVLNEEDIVIVTSKNHKLAGKRKINLDILEQSPCVFSPPGYSIRDRIETIFSKQQLTLNMQFELYSFESIKKIVKAGLCWTALPKQLYDSDLTILNVEHFSEKIQVCWYCHKDRLNSRIIIGAIKLLQDLVNSPQSSLI